MSDIIIDLSNQALNEIPKFVFKEAKINRLILDNNNISHIPAQISKLENLVELSINDNKIEKISPSISNLKNLNTISLANNYLTRIPKELFKIINLKVLYLYENQIESIDKRIAQLTNLEELILWRNNLFELPNEIGLLTNLLALDVRHNQLYKLNDAILKLSKLELLDLAFNQISELPVITKELPKLINLSLSNNPLELPPPEIAIEKNLYDSNISKIRKYFKEYLVGKTDYLFEIKLLLIGEGRVGKTSISKKLSIPRYTLKDEETTLGIEVKPWIISKKDFEKSDKTIIELKKNLRVNIWDFGGQEIYHATHQFFLTKRSIYLLVTESRQEDKHDDFYYWLNCIKVFGDNSPTIIVQNKCDQPVKDIPLKEFQKAFPNIQFLQKISCKNNSGIEELKEQLKEIIANNKLLPHLGTPLPKVWVDIRREIEDLQDRGTDYISYETYLSICRKHKMEANSASLLIEFFHDIGIVLYFKDDWELKDTVFVNHEWVTNSVYKVLDNEDVILNHGRLNTAVLEEIWKKRRYYNKRRELLSLMQKFELCFEISSNNYLVPQLLQVDEVEHDWNENENTLRYYYQYKFMPKGILTRLIVKRNNEICNSYYWRYGVILEYAETRALIREKYFERKLMIEIQGKNKKLLLEIIKKSVKEIHSDFNNIEFEEMLPCCCNSCKENHEPYFYKLSEIDIRKKKNKLTIECYLSYEDVLLNNILSNVEFSSDLIDESKNNKSVFISYAHPDTSWLVRVTTHLSVLKKEGYNLDIWSDEQIKASQKWRDEIYKSLDKAKIGILLISTDFLASDFIMDNELPILLKYAESKGTEIIPVILSPSRFLRHEILSKFQSINNPSIPLSEMTVSKQDAVLVELTDRVEEILFK